MKYVCPMHPEVVSDKKGTCPKCHMRLVEEGNESQHTLSKENTSYVPLFVIIGLIFLVSILISLKRYMGGSFDIALFMTDFMAGFFIVFAGFKLLDLKGFAEGYQTYDLLARRVPSYGYVYPFIELALGIAYLFRFELFYTNIITFFILGFSGLGVVDKLMKKERFQCACLGTAIKLPLTKVTLIEDFGMAAMAAVMLLFI